MEFSAPQKRQNFAQKKNGNKTEFSLGEKSINYSFNDGNSGRSFEVDYESISFDTSTFQQRNSWFRNVGLLWMILGAMLTVWMSMDKGKIVPSIWLVIGAVCYAIYFVRQTKYTIMESQKGNILIIEDKQHDAIKAAIENKRKEYFRKQYANINMDNDPEREMAKIEWLMEHKLITEKECDELSIKLQLGIGDEE